MSPVVEFAVAVVVLLLLAATYARVRPPNLAKGFRFWGGVLLGLASVALAAMGRAGLAFLAATGAWALLTGNLPFPLRGPQNRSSGTGGSREVPSERRGAMSRAEAFKVLGLEAGATEAQIRAAHKRLMLQIHPDKGGTSYLAAKINEAKDVLLKR